MADTSVTDVFPLINQQIAHLEKLSELVSKAEALAQIALDEHFLSYPPSTLHYYLWALSDIIENAITLNEAALSGLLKTKLVGETKQNY